ncbi:hypothetical protein ATG_08550 [Desulfurococcaceae archaeon AG1]|jgi:transcription initiation factor TFIIE subunit alpha|nr:MAG: transcription factor [Desulfurococcaceae archaeon]GAY25652.1 hypothetical protein ATG_08550 [Desulfurococcaceae archaeon AG1]
MVSGKNMGEKPRSASMEAIMGIIKNTFGETSKLVFETLLKIGREVQDEDLAMHAGLHVSEVRRILYKLSEHGFVTSRRVRDRETGYYIYFWRANTEYLPQILISRKKTVLNKLMERLKYEETYIFQCSSCSSEKERFSFDDAMINDFKCPRCGAQLEPVNNAVTVKSLRELVERLRRSVEADEKRLYNRGS